MFTILRLTVRLIQNIFYMRLSMRLASLSAKLVLSVIGLLLEAMLLFVKKLIHILERTSL